MKKIHHTGIKALTMLFALYFALAGTAFMTSCSSSDEPFYTVTEDDSPRIMNTDLTDKNLDRKTPLQIEIKVTPAHYTTVTWWLNETEMIHEGSTIDQTLPVGNHELKILATTTKGKTTQRTIKVTVTPAEGDPILAADAKSRWLTIGTTKTIGCENVTSVSKVFIGNTEATNVSYADNQITFNVPTMEEGEYLLDIVDAQGVRYGCGQFTVSTEAYVDPGIKETVIWEGEKVINWGESNVQLDADMMADVPVGATIRLEYDLVDGADYYAMRITNSSWSADVIEQFDLNGAENPFEFTYTDAQKAIVDEGNMLIVGFGYTLKKVVIVEGVAPAETTLWEGEKTINWGETNVLISPAEMADVPVGATICMYYDVTEADYHALRITTNWWGDNPEDQVIPQFDITQDTPNPFEFTYTEANKAIVDERDGMLIVGFGYTLKKVTYKK